MKKNYFICLLILLSLLMFQIQALAQLSVTSTGTNFTIDFDATVNGVNKDAFDGAGFNPSPSSGQLDGNAWRTTGFGTNHDFGATSTSEDAARGNSSGNVTIGGIFAFNVAPSDMAFGVQPGGSDFTPGTITLIVTNNTGSTVTSLVLDYEVWVYNDQGRANSFNFAYSNNDTTYTDVGALDFTSTQAADDSPEWVSTGRHTTISGLSLSDGASIYLKWSGNDISGSGSRDEFALDDIVVNMTAAATSTTWNGSSGTDWATSGNWSNGVPDTSTNVIIPDVANAPVISPTTGAEVNDLNITEADGLTIASGGSLRVSGTSSGNITYNRNIPTTNWYLISSPVVGQDIDTFVATEGLASGTGNNIGLGDFNNTTPEWEYYQNGTSGTGNFISGDGRAVLLTTAGDITFIGTLNTSDVDISITDATGSGGNAFNLVGNPYPSFIAANNSADATNNILKVNDTDNDYLSESTLWFWNQATNSYDLVNQTSSFFIAPGQAFFVSANGSYPFSFTEAMQSHQTSDTFKSSDNRPEINLVMTNGADVRDTDIYYIDGTTTGFDNGYDSSIFGGVTNEFAIYTQAVANGTGKDLGIQSLPDNDFENMIIPVGINATSGTEIIISATSANLPTGIHVYLEDKDDNSFTLLDDSSTFQTTFTNTSNGVGRFFIHTKTQPLSVDQADLNNVSIYLSDDNYLRIVGVQQGDAQVNIYSILGKQVVSTSFEGVGVNDILLPNLSLGVYMVQLKTKNGKLNKKIIIQQ